MTITKSNTELKAHAATHGGDVDTCFPGAAAISAEMAAAGGKPGGKGGKGSAPKPAKKKAAKGADLDDLFSAGLSAGPGKKKKGGKK